MNIETTTKIELNNDERKALAEVIKYIHKEMERPGLNRWPDEQAEVIKKLKEKS